MTIEDVAEKADVWSEAIKKIVKSIAAAAVALATAIGALLAWWPFGADEPLPPPAPAVLQGTGYGPQCSQLYNTIDHTWTESQWSVWEQLRKDMSC
tara:strand:+ start:520 stop:807 length:288 start_codon:yes stop_codon:yes gene_type:complete